VAAHRRARPHLRRPFQGGAQRGTACAASDPTRHRITFDGRWSVATSTTSRADLSANHRPSDLWSAPTGVSRTRTAHQRRVGRPSQGVQTVRQESVNKVTSTRCRFSVTRFTPPGRGASPAVVPASWSELACAHLTSRGGDAHRYIVHGDGPRAPFVPEQERRACRQGLAGRSRVRRARGDAHRLRQRGEGRIDEVHRDVAEQASRDGGERDPGPGGAVTRLEPRWSSGRLPAARRSFMPEPPHCRRSCDEVLRSPLCRALRRERARVCRGLLGVCCWSPPATLCAEALASRS
jgi:hypothetical protein